MLTIGHRGAAGHVTENTLASIRKAIELGADIVEVDVQRTKDGQLVLFHDKLLDRLTNLSGYLSSYTYEQLKKTILPGGYRIPLLREACEIIITSQASLLVEIISPSAKEEVVRTLSQNLSEQRFFIGSFFHDDLRDAKLSNGSLITVALVEGIPVDLEAVVEDSLCNFVGFGFDSIRQDAISRTQRLGAKVLVWTLDDPREIQRAHGLGVDGIITNFPERVKLIQ